MNFDYTCEQRYSSQQGMHKKNYMKNKGKEINLEGPVNK